MPASSRRPSQNITSTDIEAPQKSELSAISDTPLFPLNPKELLQLTKMQIRAGLPASISCVSTFASGLICLAFAGKYGNAEELAGVTLGYTWSNIGCLGILYAIDQGFCIIGSQLFGARKHQELGALFQKHLYVWSLVLIPLILSLFFSDLLLIAIGLDYETSINTGIYLKCVIPSVIGLGFFDFMKNFLMARNIFYVPAAIQGSLTVLHIFWCYLFVDILNMPVAGIAIAKCITDVLCGAIIYLYVQYSDAAGESWIPWNKAYIENWWPHLKQTMAIGANVYIEWMSYEISLFVIGMLNDPYVLGAHGIVVTLTTVFFMVLLGNSVSMQTFIANAAGEGSYNKAQKFMAVGLSINFVFTLMNALIMIFKGEYLASFFTNDERITEIITTMIQIYGFAHLQDTFANHLSGVLRTLGNERTVIANFVFTYLVIAFNCQWIFGIALGYGYPAVWAATGLGMSLMCGLMIRKVIKLDWKKEIAKIRERVDGENGGEYIEMADR